MDQVARRLRRALTLALMSFLAVFVIGFLPGPPNFFLLPLAATAVICGTLLLQQRSRSTPAMLQRLVLGPAIAGVAFVGGVIYGVLGIWGYYDVVDLLYVPLV